MKKVTIGGKEVSMYSSIKEMPMTLYNRMQGLLIQDAGIGSDMTSVFKHFEMLDTYISNGKLAEASEERKNLHFNLYAMMDGLSFQGLALGCAIHSVDGVPVTDHTDEGLQILVSALSDIGLTLGHVEEFLEELKKKFTRN